MKNENEPFTGVWERINYSTPANGYNEINSHGNENNRHIFCLLKLFMRKKNSFRQKKDRALLYFTAS